MTLALVKTWNSPVALWFSFWSIPVAVLLIYPRFTPNLQDSLAIAVQHVWPFFHFPTKSDTRQLFNFIIASQHCMQDGMSTVKGSRWVPTGSFLGSATDLQVPSSKFLHLLPQLLTILVKADEPSCFLLPMLERGVGVCSVSGQRKGARKAFCGVSSEQGHCSRESPFGFYVNFILNTKVISELLPRHFP